MTFATSSTYGGRLGHPQTRNAPVQLVPSPSSQKGPLATRRIGDRCDSPTPPTDFDRTSFPPQLEDHASRSVVVVPKPGPLPKPSPSASVPTSSSSTGSKRAITPASTALQEVARTSPHHQPQVPYPKDEGLVVDLASNAEGTPPASLQSIPPPSPPQPTKNDGFFSRFFRAIFCFSMYGQDDA